LEETAEELPLQQFDAVFSNFVLHWCKNKEKIFKQVAKRLQRGGKFAFTTPADYDAAITVYSSKHVQPRKSGGSDQQCTCSILNKNRQRVLENNFVIVKLEKHKVQWVFDNVKKLIEFYRTHYKDQMRENFQKLKP
jgi:trans-aconitate methyltransferase